jgi:hypothetical protein
MVWDKNCLESINNYILIMEFQEKTNYSILAWSNFLKVCKINIYVLITGFHILCTTFSHFEMAGSS